jgi:hypothetical protein
LNQKLKKLKESNVFCSSLIFCDMPGFPQFAEQLSKSVAGTASARGPDPGRRTHWSPATIVSNGFSPVNETITSIDEVRFFDRLHHHCRIMESNG